MKLVLVLCGRVKGESFVIVSDMMCHIREGGIGVGV